MELLEALTQTFDHTTEIVSGVRTDQLDRPTPCPDWDLPRDRTHDRRLARENNAPTEKRHVRVASCPRWSRFEFGLGDQSQVTTADCEDTMATRARASSTAPQRRDANVTASSRSS